MGPRTRGAGQTVASEFDEDETLEGENMKGVPWVTDAPSNSDPDSMFEDSEVVHELGCMRDEDCACADNDDDE